jgi:hypothetical protein
VSDLEKRVNPNATIQIDKIDAAELVDLEEEAAARAAEAAPPSMARRTAPPPLPAIPTAEAPPGAPQTRLRETGGGSGKKILYGAAFVALLVGAIVAGLAFGARMRGEAPVAASAAPPAPSPAASASTTSHALTVPAVEISGP